MDPAGVYIFNLCEEYEELVGWGEKYNDLLRKRKYKGEEVEKRGKRGKFPLYFGEKITFLKRGDVKNILFWASIHLWDPVHFDRNPN